MAVTCPKCNGIYSVKRLKYPTVTEEMQRWKKGSKSGQREVSIDKFICHDCGEVFHSEGKTIMEVTKNYT